MIKSKISMLIAILSVNSAFAGTQVSTARLISDLKNARIMIGSGQDCELSFKDKSKESGIISITMVDNNNQVLTENVSVYEGNKVYMINGETLPDDSYTREYALDNGATIRFQSIDDAAFEVEMFSDIEGMRLECLIEF